MPFQKSVALKRLVVRDLLSVPNSCLSAFCRTLSWTKNGLRRFAIHRLGRKTGFGVLPNAVSDEKWSSAFCRTSPWRTWSLDFPPSKSTPNFPPPNY